MKILFKKLYYFHTEDVGKSSFKEGLNFLPNTPFPYMLLPLSLRERGIDPKILKVFRKDKTMTNLFSPSPDFITILNERSVL